MSPRTLLFRHLSSARPFAVLLATALLIACGSDALAPDAPNEPDGVPLTTTYRVDFQAAWSAATHPADFPPGPHFSGLVGATHDATASIWSAGATASPGIRNMAETGGKQPLLTELGDSGGVDAILSGGGINPSPGSVTLTFTARQSHPLVTLVSMIAPSPDWFVGVHDLPLFENGAWQDEVVVELLAYDAGTDSGPEYTSPNQTSTPQGEIARILTSPFDPPTPLGTFTFTRVGSR